MNYKFDNMHDGAGVLDVERGQLPGIRTLPWQTDTSLSNESWGYIDGDTYKQPTELIHELVDVVSKNGNLLLNIGPRSDGTIPEAAKKTLLEIGGWLDVNGEAIYGSRPWLLPKPNFGEGPTEVSSGSMQEKEQKPFTSSDFRFTTNKGFIYAIELGWQRIRGDHSLVRLFRPTRWKRRPARLRWKTGLVTKRPMGCTSAFPKHLSDALPTPSALP
jgi:alpha-L-fucosidase